MDKIGQGAFGAVYKAKSDSGQYVAVKDIHDTQHFNPLEIEPAMLSLPFNSQVIEVFHPQESQVSLVYPLYSGGDLRSYMKTKGPLGADEVHELAAQLAYGIWELHLEGYVHRDLKPANIMRQGGKLVIADYGLAVGECFEKPIC